MRRPPAATRPSDDPDPEDFLPLPHLPFHVLLALGREPLHGWGILKRMEEISGGKEVPSSGSLYLAMGRLEERGLVEQTEGPAEGDARRKYLRLTPLGRRVLAAETERLSHLVGEARRSLDGPATDR